MAMMRRLMGMGSPKGIMEGEPDPGKGAPPLGPGDGVDLEMPPIGIGDLPPGSSPGQFPTDDSGVPLPPDASRRSPGGVIAPRPGPSGGFTPMPGRSGETPRDRATPPRPRVPTPGAGSVSQPPSVGGLLPFQPLGGGYRGLFGRNRGLQGGGLGVMSPAAGAESESIDGLLQLLMSMAGRGQ